MEDDDVTGLLPIPATQAHLGSGGHQPLSPILLLEAALTLAPGFPPDPWAASSRQTPSRFGGGQSHNPLLQLLPRAQTEIQRVEVFLL